MLMLTVPPGRLGTEPAEGRSPGIELSEGSPGIEPAEGKLGSGLGAGAPEPEPPDGGVGAGTVDGTGGNEGTAGRLGSPKGPETQTVTPLVLSAWTDPPPAGVVALPLPERVPGTGSDGVAGVLTHCGPVGIPVGRDGTPGSGGSEGGAGCDDRPVTDEAVSALCVAPLGKTLATAIATAATPAAPPASRTIRP
jgi:hypothetical protein